MKAKDILIKAGTVLSAVLFLSAGLGFSSQAAAQSASLKIPVKISTSGAAPEETYTVTIERDPSNPNAPLPSPNQVSVKGTGAKDYILEFPEMVYTTEGDYKYTIKQTVGTQSNFTYDSRTYTLLVKTTEITTDASGNAVSPYILPVFWVGTGENSAKHGDISFYNRYNRNPNPGPNPGPNPRPNPGPNPNPNPNPNPSNPSVLGATRPSSVEPGVLGVDREPKVPEVLGALRQVATGDASFMALYGLFAALSLMSLLFWGLGYKKQGQKKENRG
ncbi:Spy0128 family protein [Oribacterium sinus]